MEHATRTILHANVTGQPTAAWTLQQLRAAIPANHAYRFLIHDRDRIFSQQLDQQVQHLGLRVLKTPVCSPQANALCERLLGTLRRECLDFLIPLTENHVRHLLHGWALHYNIGRPHMTLGPGIPRPPPPLPAPRHVYRHRLRRTYGLQPVRSSVDCTTNTGWKSTWHDKAVRVWRRTRLRHAQERRLCNIP
jgi:putative transposase